MIATVAAPVFAVATFVLQNAPGTDLDPNTVTPGPVGFAAIFLVAAATVLLGFDMVRRIRRTNYRAEIKARLEAEIAARDETKPE
jgi:divalent metal cation (Fe/Co/Zn/Cd) transporter